jgi:hypothetical protein
MLAAVENVVSVLPSLNALSNSLKDSQQGGIGTSRQLRHCSVMSETGG